MGVFKNYSYQGQPDYTVYKQGSVYKAKEISTGSIQKSSTVFNTLVEDLLDDHTTIFFKAGTYTYTGAIDIPAASEDIKLIGAGSGTWDNNGSTEFVTGDNVDCIMADGGSVGNRLKKFTVEGIKFNNTGRTYTGRGIYLNYVVAPEIINCGFRSIVDHAIEIDLGVYAPIIDRCRFQHCGDETGSGSNDTATIRFNGNTGDDKITNPQITNCVFEVDRYRSIQVGTIVTHPIWRDNTFEIETYQITHMSGSHYYGLITGNEFYDAGTNSTAIQVTQDCTISDNFIRSYLIGIITSSERQIVKGNTIRDTTQYGIRIAGDNHIIANNMVYQCGGDAYSGIRCHTSNENILIIGNYVLACGTNGIDLSSSSDRCLIVGNIVLNDGSGHTDDCINIDGDNNYIHGNQCYDGIVNNIDDNGSGNTSSDNQTS